MLTRRAWKLMRRVWEYDEGSVIEDEMSDVEDIMNAVFGEEGGIYEDSSEGEGGYLDENIDEEYS